MCHKSYNPHVRYFLANYSTKFVLFGFWASKICPNLSIAEYVPKIVPWQCELISVSVGRYDSSSETRYHKPYGIRFICISVSVLSVCRNKPYALSTHFSACHIQFDVLLICGKMGWKFAEKNHLVQQNWSL